MFSLLFTIELLLIKYFKLHLKNNLKNLILNN